MTPEQCHLVYNNSQQVEESAGWDRYSRSDLHDQQMDGQDELSKRIYNNRGRQSQFLGHLKALAVKHRRTEKKKNSSSD